MNDIFKETLFRKNTLVSTPGMLPDADPVKDQSPLDVLYALVNLFGIHVISGGEHATPDMIRFTADMLGKDVPEPFYRGFPGSVRQLSPDELLYDQLLHYTLTYGLGFFNKEWHSMLETLIERTPLDEDVQLKDFTIVTEEEAIPLLEDIIRNLLASTRPLNSDDYNLVETYIRTYSPVVERCASKDTAVKLLTDTRDLQFAEFLQMSDVPRLLDYLLLTCYPDQKINKLNLRNQDRKFLRDVMNRLFELNRCDITNCFEKKAVWSGLLHHIHYEPVDRDAQEFADAMRGSENRSVYAEFERHMMEKEIQAAVDALNRGKGSAAVLRQLNYIASRCITDEELRYVLDRIETRNAIVLIQLLQKYTFEDSDSVSPRTFRFVAHNKLHRHYETDEEVQHRRSFVSEAQSEIIRKFLTVKLREVLSGRLGRVFVDPEMENIALPLQEGTTMSGYGVLPKGSRVPIVDGKIVRAFTYWEKVNDIDLSCFLLDETCDNSIEFSWRTMRNKQSDAFCFSGDETSGYNGGSEYFDINLTAVRELYPEMKYIVFCDNVYTGKPFTSCFCKAGYMLRSSVDSGEVYEPKTVQSSFTIDCDSTFAYLFAIDLETNEMIWLNTAVFSHARIAGVDNHRLIMPYLHTTELINVRSFAEMIATELADAPEEAEIVFSDRILDLPSDAEQIHSYDIDKMLKLMNA